MKASRIAFTRTTPQHRSIPTTDHYYPLSQLPQHCGSRTATHSPAAQPASNHIIIEVMASIEAISPESGASKVSPQLVAHIVSKSSKSLTLSPEKQHHEHKRYSDWRNDPIRTTGCFRHLRTSGGRTFIPAIEIPLRAPKSL